MSASLTPRANGPHGGAPDMQAQPYRNVRFVGIGGASATGKTTLATRLAESLRSPTLALSADWYSYQARDRGPCKTHACCEELISSVDLEGLAQDLSELAAALASLPPGLVPELTFGHRAHGVCGMGRDKPASIARVGCSLTHDTVYVVVDGFRLFGDPSVCTLLHAGIWLEAEDGELLARRRFVRQGGRFLGDEPDAAPADEERWRDFREEYMDHIHAHYLQAAPGMLTNASAILRGTITINAGTAVDGIVAEARQLVLEGSAEEARGSKWAAPAAPAASASASTTTYCSPPRPTLSTPTSPPPSSPPLPSPPPSVLAASAASPTDSSATTSPATPESTLAALPAGSRVALLDFLGSLCPITTCHVRCLVEARRILTGEALPVNADGALQPYAACLGAVSVNSTAHVRSKLLRAGEEALSERDRLHLCQLATASEASWIRVGTSADTWAKALAAAFPALRFVVWALNGADDVVRYRKWEWATPARPFITMGRDGHTGPIIKAIRRKREQLASDVFVLGPDLPGVSATEARSALRLADDAMLKTFLHLDVTAWLQRYGPYRCAAI